MERRFKIHPIAADFVKCGATAKETSRLAISGVCANAHADGYRLAATDGTWLATWTAEADGEPFAVIIPPSALKSLGVKAKTEAIDVVNRDGAYSLECDGKTVAFEPVAGTFPPIDDVIPEKRVATMKGGTGANAIGLGTPMVSAMKLSEAFTRRTGSPPGFYVSIPESPKKPVRMDRETSSGTLTCVVMPFALDD